MTLYSLQKYSLKTSRLLTKKYKNLSKEEIQYLRDVGVLNGFGGASQSWIVRWLIGWILADFDKAIPDMHDFSYAVGGNESRRIVCDEKFYQAMLDDIRARYDNHEIGKWELVWKSIVANLAWTAINYKGSKYFQYKSLFYS